MKIRVGSKNPVKVDAVKEYFPEFDVESIEVDSGIAEQPKSLEETMRGAQTRAFRCRDEADWGIGIETGIMPVESTSTGWMNIVICTIWTGLIWADGMSSGFVVPKPVIEIAFRDNVDLSEAVLRAGLTTEKRVGYKEGVINVLTNGKMARKPYVKQAIMMAMIQIDHPKLF